MEIIEKQYFEQKDFPKGYGRMHVESEQDIWNLIMEVMNENPTKRYLKHFQRSEWTPTFGIYDYHGPCNDIDIPLGIHKEFLQVYVEDK